MHADEVVALLRRRRRRARLRLAILIASAAIAVTATTAPAGLVEWWIDWWSRPSQPRQEKPVVKTVRVMGGADC